MINKRLTKNFTNAGFTVLSLDQFRTSKLSCDDYNLKDRRELWEELDYIWNSALIWILIIQFKTKKLSIFIEKNLLIRIVRNI